ncbi:MAG: condensation domain-containing protein [Erysipelotrichaceae bacterium]
MEQEYLPLSPSQSVMLMAMKYMKRNTVNVGSSLWFEEPMQVDLLQQAIIKACERMDATQLRLTKRRGKIVQYLHPMGSMELVVQEVSKLTSAQIMELLDELSQQAYPWKDTPLLHFRLLVPENNHVILYLVVNHIIMDAYGLMVLLRDILGLYESLLTNRPLPCAPTPFWPVLQQELAYVGSKKEQDDRLFWDEMFASKPGYGTLSRSRINADHRQYIRNTHSHPLHYRISKEEVQALMRFAKEQHLSPQAIILAAMFMDLHALNHKEEAVIGLVVSRRDRLERKQCGGMLINPLFIRIHVDQDATFLKACHDIMEVMQKAFRHGDYPFMQVHRAVWKKHRPSRWQLPGNFMDIVLTFQYAQIEDAPQRQYHYQYHSNGTSSVMAYVTLMDLNHTQGLEAYVEHCDALIQEVEINRFMEATWYYIAKGIANPATGLYELVNGRQKNVNEA